MMSADNSEAEAADMMYCASCFKLEVDDVKLKPCDGCDLVKYCSDNCKEYHRPLHEAACKERAAKLRDEILFRQPESTHLGDCPICCLPLPIDKTSQNGLQSCCTKIVCQGCSYADEKRLKRENQEHTCPFCRHLLPATLVEAHLNEMRRIAANDPLAMTQMGLRLFREGDHDDAFKYWTKAAELGDAIAHYELSKMYRDGGQSVARGGVTARRLRRLADEKREIYHLEEAAIRGHAEARFNLAMKEGEKKRFERSVKHFTIAANLGEDKSLEALKVLYKGNVISKERFAAALRAHHAAVNATKSPQREAAKKYYSSQVLKNLFSRT